MAIFWVPENTDVEKIRTLQHGLAGETKPPPLEEKFGMVPRLSETLRKVFENGLLHKKLSSKVILCLEAKAAAEQEQQDARPQPGNPPAPDDDDEGRGRRREPLKSQDKSLARRKSYGETFVRRRSSSRNGGKQPDKPAPCPVPGDGYPISGKGGPVLRRRPCTPGPSTPWRRPRSRSRGRKLDQEPRIPARPGFPTLTGEIPETPASLPPGFEGIYLTSWVHLRHLRHASPQRGTARERWKENIYQRP